jgi:CRP-like cAMP-binding protein
MLATKEQTAALVGIFQRGTRLTYKKGEFVIRPGENPTGVFFIEHGIVKAYDITKYGEENLLIIRKENEIFPLIWAVTNEERSVIYQALSETVLWRISRKDFQDYLKQPDRTLAPLLDMTMEMYRIHSERIVNLEYRTVRERLISFLLTTSKRFGVETKNGIVLYVPLKQQDIASSINASRETTSRELSSLEKKGLIETGQPNMVITNIKKLESYL